MVLLDQGDIYCMLEKKPTKQKTKPTIYYILKPLK